MEPTVVRLSQRGCFSMVLSTRLGWEGNLIFLDLKATNDPMKTCGMNTPIQMERVITTSQALN